MGRRTFLPPGIHSEVSLDKCTADTAVLFFAGIGASANVWSLVTGLIHALSPAIDCFRIDPPGCGNRPKRDCHVTVAAGAAAVADWYDNLRRPYDRVILVGHSAGGIMAHEVARQLHSRGISVAVHYVDASLESVAQIVKRPVYSLLHHPHKTWLMARLLIYLGVPDTLLLALFNHPGSPVTRVLRPFIHRPAKLTPWALRLVLVDMSRTGGITYLRVNRDYPFELMPHEAVWPLAFTYGENDPLSDPSDDSLLLPDLYTLPHERWPKVLYIVDPLPDVGHCSPLENPSAVAAQIAEFIHQIRSAAPAA